MKVRGDFLKLLLVIINKVGIEANENVKKKDYKLDEMVGA